MSFFPFFHRTTFIKDKRIYKGDDTIKKKKKENRTYVTYLVM
jgi:hypothetical protein